MAEKPAKRWWQEATEHSNALGLERGVFTLDSPRKIASSLKRSAEQSHPRKSDPYRSAMSMLTFYINRASKHLSIAPNTTFRCSNTSTFRKRNKWIPNDSMAICRLSSLSEDPF